VRQPDRPSYRAFQLPGIQTQLRPFHRQRPRDQRQRWGPGGGGGRTSCRGGGIGGIAQRVTVTWADGVDRRSSEGGAADELDAVATRGIKTQTGQAIAATTAANIPRRSSISAPS